MGSLEKMNPIRPDDQTLEDLFQRTIVIKFISRIWFSYSIIF